MSVTQGFSAIEFAIGIDGQMIAGTGDFSARVATMYPP